MAANQGRRQFLQASLAAGTVLTVAGVNATHGDARVPATEANANPTVRPGRVRWQRDFAAAREASRGSGKPVFLFHMMGRLDQQFC